MPALLLFPVLARAHAFGQRYDLPLPLGLYLWGAGAAVAASFLVAVLFLRGGASAPRRWRIDISQTLPGRFLTARPLRILIELASLGLFALVLVTGLSGRQDAATNFAPIFIWVIWWVGMAYLVAGLGNLWDLLNPWRVLDAIASRLIPRYATPLFAYPQWLGYWPALVLFFIFAYLEFISGVAQHPATLAWLVMIYSAITLIAMRLFGAETWRQHGEVFSVVFGLMARFGVFRGDAGRLVLRLPGAGLASEPPVSLSLMAVCLLMLSTVSFDGFIETPLWREINTVVYTAVIANAAIVQSISAEVVQRMILGLALVMYYLLLGGAYLGASYCVGRLSTVEHGTLAAARAYVLSLVPIAIAYHLAHYLSYLLLAGQLMIPILSDPFASGWDLFGTRSYAIDIGIIGAKEVWILSVCAIVIGHIAAVCVAHAIALRRETRARSAIISQLPMLVLMIAFTMLSLWILSQPIIA